MALPTDLIIQDIFEEYETMPPKLRNSLNDCLSENLIDEADLYENVKVASEGLKKFGVEDYFINQLNSAVVY